MFYIECIFERFTWLSHVHLSVRSSVWSVLITDLNYIGTGFLTPNSAWKFLYITQIKFIWVPRPIACKSIISFLREVFNTKLSAFDICYVQYLHLLLIFWSDRNTEVIKIALVPKVPSSAGCITVPSEDVVIYIIVFVMVFKTCRAGVL